MSNKNLYIYICLVTFFMLANSCGSAHEEHEDEEEHHHEAGLHISDEMASEFGIEYETVTPGEFHDVLKTSGEIIASGSDIYTATARQSGIVTLAPGITLGMNLKKGERIASISSEGLQGGDVNRAAAANLEAAKAEYVRLKPLYEDGLVTASTFREAERNFKEAQALAGTSSKGGSQAIISPADGTLQNLFVNSGEYVDLGAPIAIIGKNINMQLRADLPARESRHLGEIVTANVRSAASGEVLKLTEMNGKKVTGNFSASASNGYIPVYFSFEGDPVRCPAGYAEVYLICGERKGVISVAKDAIVEIQGNKYVYVDDDHHGIEKRLIQTGAGDGERIEVTEGLQPGETIVAKGASIVRMAEVSAVAPPSHSHNH